MNRRTFLQTLPAAAGAVALVGALPACGSSMVRQVTVESIDDGRSVYVATSRWLEVRVSRDSWQNAQLAGLAKVTAIDGYRSDTWVFEIDGRRYDGTLDAAEATTVRAGQVITWREV